MLHCHSVLHFCGVCKCIVVWHFHLLCVQHFPFLQSSLFLHVYYLAYAEASSRLAFLFWNRNWICMKYAHTKLHLTLGGGNTWQSPLPEMIVLRKTLDDDDVDEVFFCAEIECQKNRRRLAFYALYAHFFFSLTISSICHSAAYSDTLNWRNINTQIAVCWNWIMTKCSVI